MGLDLNRWFNYAKARVNSAVGQANTSLDRREAEREADLADKPWLRSDGESPTLDEARARIEWEAERQAMGDTPDQAGESAHGDPRSGTPTTANQSRGTGGTDETGRTDEASAGPAPRSPQDIAAEAERETARLELEQREQASVDRLKAIREELGVDDPAPPPEST